MFPQLSCSRTLMLPAGTEKAGTSRPRLVLTRILPLGAYPLAAATLPRPNRATAMLATPRTTLRASPMAMNSR